MPLFKKEKHLNFNTIVLITRFVLQNKESSPCFAIFVTNRHFPLLFVSSSEKKLQEWVNQIAIYCHKLAGISSLQNACSNCFG